MNGKRITRVLMVTMAVILLGGVSVSAAPQHQNSDAITIEGDPLRIYVYPNASIQVYHSRYVHGAVYGGDYGSSGPFIAVGGTTYGPNDLPAGPYLTALTPVEHEGPFGSGTRGDPFRVVTTQRLTAGGTDLTLVQTVSYIDGNNHFQLDWQITNDGGSQTCFTFYHGADYFFANSDIGTGYHDPGTGAVGGYSQEENRDWFMVFFPVTPADHYLESDYWDIWGIIQAGQDLNDQILDVAVDNGVALQWDRCVGGGATVTITDQWRFGDTAEGVVNPGGPPPEQGGGPVDVWLKDSPEDDGTVPSSANNPAWWTSPDIWVNNEGGDEHQDPIQGRTNDVYVRVRNRGTEDVEDVEVVLYYADANVLNPTWPDRFHEIDSVEVDVPADDEVVAGPIAWELEESGHLCLLARLESDQDPITAEGNVPGDNNIAQRNVHGLEMSSRLFSSTGSASIQVIATAPDDGVVHVIDIRIQYPNRPPDVTIIIILPEDLMADWEDAGGDLDGGEVEEVDGRNVVVATDDEETVIHNLPIDPGDEAGIEIQIEGPTDEPFLVGVVEEVDEEGVGGNVYMYEGLRAPSGGACCQGLLGAILIAVVAVVIEILRPQTPCFTR